MDLDEQNLAPIVAQLVKLYRRVRQIEADRAGKPAAPVAATPFSAKPEGWLPKRHEFDTVAGGLRYAVWCIGDTLGHIGGEALMRQVFDRFEAALAGDARASAWLNSRWNDAGPAGCWAS